MLYKIHFQLRFCVIEALEDGKLDLSTAFFVVQGMIAHWLKIVSYHGATGQLQEFQHVEGRVCVSCVVCIKDCRFYVTCFLFGTSFRLAGHGRWFLRGPFVTLQSISTRLP